jgi:hypothetical protein
MHWRLQHPVAAPAAEPALPAGALARLALWVGLAAAALFLPAEGGAQTLKTISGGRVMVDGPDYGFVDGDSTYVAQFHMPMGCVVDAGGNLLVADNQNGAIRKLDLERNTTSSIITNLNGPIAVARDRTNNLYVLNQGSGTVLRYGWSDTLYLSPRVVVSNLNNPTALVLDAETNLYITELSGSVKRVRVTDGLVTQVRAGLSGPRGVAVLDNGLLAVSESSNNVLRLIDPAGGGFAGQIGTGAAGFRDGLWAEAQFNRPHQLAKAPNGMLMVADRLNHRMRLVTTNGVVSTLYGVDPSLWAPECLTCNPLQLPGWYDGVNGSVSSAEAREPVGVTVDKDGTVYTTEVYYHIIRQVTGAGLAGTGGGGENTNLVVLAPVVGVLSGYYPMGVDIQVVNPNSDPVLVSRVVYTTDGTEPGADNPSSVLLLLGTNNVGVIQWRETSRDLSSLRVKAFLGGVGSPTVSGQAATENRVGVAGDVSAGLGATVVVPVVATLKPGQSLRSLQFLVEVAPLGKAGPLAVPVRALPMSPNDFVGLIAASTNTPLTRSETTAGGTNRVEVAFIGTNAAFRVQSFATVTLLAITIPATNQVNDRYRIAVLSPSGTADGAAQDVPLASLPPCLITVTNQSYLVGDAAPAGWYNAGSFGDGQLKNNDVNNALYASLGIRVPPFFTDVFDAMDVFPEDTSGSVGGDGKIRFLDWQVLLDRSLGFRTNNWTRCWSVGGLRVATATNAPPNGRPSLAADALPAAKPALTVELARLKAQAQLAAESQGQVQPGSQVTVPVQVSVAASAALAGLQFRAVVQPEGDAPALAEPVLFTPTPTLPAPIQTDGLPLNQVAVAWSPLVNPFATRLTGRLQVGALSFRVPAAAVAGCRYTVQLANADGAPDLQTPYDIETEPGSVAVLAAPAAPPNPSYKLSWLGQQGRRYVVESTTDLSSGHWRLEAADLAGRGRLMEFVDQNPVGEKKFYRVGLAP